MKLPYKMLFGMCLLLLSCSSLLAQTTTYNFTGSPQTYTVPAGVFNISIEAYGAQGNSNAQSVAGGLGGYATGELSVTPGEVLTIYVGGGGTVSTTGGYNGGGDAGFSPCGAAMGGGGGGASDVRQGGTTLSDRVIVGGGGSGPGGSRIAGCGRGTGGGGGGGYYGGGGGAAWPFQSATPGGTGGTQATGGTGGTSTYTSVLNNNGTNGTLGQGGNGGEEVSTSQGGSGTANVGSAGGGLTGDTGTYGVNWTGAGGGGGSSYVGGLANSATTSGVQSGNGQVLITVLGNQPPVAVCQDYTAQLDGSGNVTIQAADVDGGSTDPDMDTLILSVSPDTFTCANIGPNTVTLTVDDGNGGVDTCTATVTVEDTIAPIITCPSDVTVACDEDVLPGSSVPLQLYGTDAASGNLINIDMASGIGSIVGNSSARVGIAWNSNTDVTYARDFSNLYTIDLTTATTTLIGPSGASITALTFDSTQSVLYSINQGTRDFYEIDPATGTATLIGNTGIPGGTTLGLATDASGTVWVGTINGDLYTVDTNTGVATLQYNTVYADGLTSMAIHPTTGSLYIVSLINDELVEVDLSTGTSTLIGGPVGGNDMRGLAFVGGVSGGSLPAATASDNCTGNPTITFSDVETPGSCPQERTITRTWTATDASGNSSSCVQTISVVDTTAPVVTCPSDVTTNNDPGACGAVVTYTVSGTDNCGMVTVTQTGGLASGDLFPVGTTTNTFDITDECGNTSTCSFTVTVNDTEAPTAVCQDITVQLDESGNATIVASDVDGGSTDNCGIASLAIDVDTFDCSNVGTNPVVLTVTDVNGNSSTCTATVTVEDNIAPVIACPMDITLPNDPGVCGAEVNFGDASAADACGIATVLQTAGLPSGSTFPVGTSTVEFTATDVNGNTSTCSFTVTVQDTELPVAVCQDITIQLDALGFASITAADIDGGSSDNCGVASISASQTDFDCSDVGDNNITLTVTDVNGNSSTCTATVTVEDVTAPVVACTDITVILDVNGTVTINGTDIDGGSSDACGIATYELDIDTFDCSNVGDNPVTLTVTDVNGNSASCTATVTVIDDIAPDLVCMDITLELDENGFASIVPEDVMANNTDACGILTTGVDIEDFSCADIGTPVLVTVFSQDNNGNLSSCTATVTVVDVTGPVIENCPGDLTVDPGVNNLFYELPDYWATTDVTATDNCTDPVAVFGQDPAPGTLLPDGTYTITLTTEDEYGNESSCSFELTVESVLGTQEVGIDLTSVALYPNPAKDVVTLHNPQSVVVEQAAIYDLNGKLVRTFDLRGQGTQNYTLDVSTLQMATYLVVIQTEKGTVTKQLIKG